MPQYFGVTRRAIEWAKWDEAALLAGDFRHGGMIDIEKIQSDYRTMAFTVDRPCRY
ncbi:MAG: hypothetical protein IPG76_07835 [Acidobacteria bacterium]|nr:hypothetical protein [Acidobacteriota bacterium]